MLVILENGRVALEVELPIDIIESVHYERGMLRVNDYLIGVVLPSKEISVQVLDGGPDADRMTRIVWLSLSFAVCT